MKKQILSGLLVLTMLLLITACTNTGEPTATDAGSADKETLVEETAEEIEETDQVEDTVAPAETTSETEADPDDDYPEDRLIVNKDSYTEGDQIFITAHGSGRDWVAISRVGEKRSLCWWYLDEVEGFVSVGSGRRFDATSAKANGATGNVLTYGDYIVYLIPDDKEIEDNDYIQIKYFSVAKSADGEDEDQGLSDEPLTQFGMEDLLSYYDYWREWYGDND